VYRNFDDKNKSRSKKIMGKDVKNKKTVLDKENEALKKKGKTRASKIVAGGKTRAVSSTGGQQDTRAKTRSSF
jgi:hypothetical protein